jgi:hypothetical protein
MNNVDEILKFFGTVTLYGGGSAAVAYGVFRYLGKGWIDARFAERLETFKHDQAKEIQRLKIEVESILNGALKMQEREFTVLPEAWEKLHKAYGLTRSLVSPIQSYPATGRMSDVELEEFLAGTTFTESQKQNIRNAPTNFSSAKGKDRDGIYQDILFWYQLHDVKKSVGSLQSYVESNGLFLPTELKQMFKDMTPLLWSAVVALEVSKDDSSWKMRSEAWEKLEAKAVPLHAAIEKAIEERLHSHGKPLKAS